ncbi:MAG: 16S rRNA (cytosine(1402)-N(4))-methyltransferase RsmH [Candidatus Cloacimonadota bacterium]|nr:MAG: 16S rRNA (cytosine(1402)-N(4))-methyltransferase RsmH [Candidatus Cloacimonadota bacterium]
MDSFHKPVLTNEIVKFLAPKKNNIYVDATLGTGGHTLALLRKEPNLTIVGIDQDKEAIELAKQNLQQFKNRVIFIQENFNALVSILALNKIKKIDGILFDLGISSNQIDSNRGFSYLRNSKLDMRMNQNTKLNAFQIINNYKERELIDIFKKYGEERFATPIAKRIVKIRMKSPIETTSQLANIIDQAIRKRNLVKTKSRIFQAIRIVVNNELFSLREALKDCLKVLNVNGRIVAISYHSLEDRIIKKFFQYESLKCICPPNLPKCGCNKIQTLKIITRKPVVPTDEEIKNNSRARSAKLRVAERCYNERKINEYSNHYL